MSNIKLIVGLGNPGPEYQNTRHNAGAIFLENLASHFNITLKYDAKFFGFCGRVTIAGNDIRLLIPTTYMNRSGQSVAAIAGFYKIQPSELLVAFDELDFPPGVAKLKIGGSSSQNGIRDIVKSLANQEDFIRLRIGIGHPGDKSKVTGHVLSKAPNEQHNKMLLAIDHAISCIPDLISSDFKTAQQKLHSFKAE
ncbi:MAG: aminoacyl-tRNA hydrolase [Pseudomonadota bacterium]